jgi:hypothetical protein
MRHDFSQKNEKSMENTNYKDIIRYELNLYKKEGLIKLCRDLKIETYNCKLKNDYRQKLLNYYNKNLRNNNEKALR